MLLQMLHQLYFLETNYHKYVVSTILINKAYESLRASPCFHTKGICLWQVVDALELAQATMAKVYQNLSWAVAYNVIAIPIAAGVLLPQYDFAMTPSLSGE